MAMDNNSECNELAVTFIRCPACHDPLPFLWHQAACSCAQCGFEVPVVDGIPLLVKDRALLDQTIAEAKSSGRADWYEAPQDVQTQGPYRHHLLKRRQYVEKVLKDYLAQSTSVPVALDLGCGDGLNTSWLLNYFPQMYASDYNLLRLLRSSRRNPGARVFMADVTDYPVTDHAFDVIFFNHVLEHIPEDEKALAEVYRMLKPGGLLILGVPNEGAFFWQMAYKLQPASLASSDHLHFYTAGSISEKCLDAGFTIKEIYPIGWGLPEWRVDAMVRGCKWVDDLFEKAGRALIPSQATSLYLLLTK
jgi:ubiquinone/menaquinone biosynthesis C-methylase UbiE/uncharacterized protein YbaR (Trm112 family)